MGTTPDKSSTPLDPWAPMRRGLITAPDLTDREKLVLGFLMTFDLPDNRAQGNRKRFVHVSRATIAKAFDRSVRQMAKIFASLEAKGYIRRVDIAGKVAYTYLEPKVYGEIELRGIDCFETTAPVSLNDPPLVGPVNLDDTPTREPGRHGSGIPVSLDDTPPVNSSDTPPVSFNDIQKNRIEEEKLRDVGAHSSSADFADATSQYQPQATKAKRQRKNVAKPRFEDVKAAVEAVDLTELIAKYRDLNVDAEFEQWKDYVLYGVNKAGKAPWTLPYTHWDKVFENWLRNARKWNGNRATATKTPAAHPVPQMPDLSNFTLD
ncbi:MAG: helix-turn-helix domain-containing protein [Thermodesulfobacteriota bacterium]